MNALSWGKVSIIGAAGKMGRGIALVVLQEMARSLAVTKGVVEGGELRLNLIDLNEEAVFTLRRYLKPHLVRYAEKNINALRQYFAHNPNLISNREMIDYFVEGALDIVHCDSTLFSAHNSKIVFEAVIEDLVIKKAVLAQLKDVCGAETLFFTNTSSIPISMMDEVVNLNHRIVGFHFYNPPPVQKLVEMVFPKSASQEVIDFALEVAKSLHKTVVVASDVAGFIGNGHFIREIAKAVRLVESLSSKYSHEEAIAIVDSVSRDFLLRPMGIFQLIDYVGIDICQAIAEVMEKFIPTQGLTQEVLENMLKRKIRGGQKLDGSQLPGFFEYEGSVPKKVYSYEKGEYLPIPPKTLEVTGDKPKSSWKNLQKQRENKINIIKALRDILEHPCLATDIANELLQNSATVSQNLVNDGVAKSLADVETVLITGFYHLYGPSDIIEILQGRG
jgi:3-hydroxyacyl-CoA dehydrogenase